jgi:hypothetical protein
MTLVIIKHINEQLFLASKFGDQFVLLHIRRFDEEACMISCLSVSVSVLVCSQYAKCKRHQVILQPT